MQNQYGDPRNGGGSHYYSTAGEYGKDSTAGAGRRPPPRGDITYWGHMITEGQHPPQPTDKFSRLLIAIAEYIKEHLDPKDVKALTPEKLSSFYRAVGGGGLDALFLDTPPSNLSQIYTTLGCSHSLEPSNDDFRPPQNPALTARGFQIWQTVQLLIDPAEHVPYIRNAVHQFELRDLETGEYFPREIPEEAFPDQPDEATIRWHDEVFDKAHKEAALKSPLNPPGPHQPRHASRPPGERIIVDDPADLDDPGWWAGNYYRPRQRRRRHVHPYGAPPPRTRKSVPEFHVHPGIHTTTTAGPGGIREHHHHIHHPPGGLHAHAQHHTLPRHRPQSFVSTAATAGGGGPDLRPRPIVIDDDASITSSDVEGEEGGEYGIRGRQRGPPVHAHAPSYSHSRPRRPPSGPPPSQPLPSRRASQSRERGHSTSRRSHPRTNIPKAYVYVTPDGEPATIYPNNSGGIRVQPGLSPHHLHPSGPPPPLSQAPRSGPPPLHTYSSYPNLNIHHPPPPPPAGSHPHERGRSGPQKYPIPSHPDPYASPTAPLEDLDSEFEPAHLRYLRPRSSSPPLGGGKKRNPHLHSHPPGGYSSGGGGGGAGNYTPARYDSDDDDYDRDRRRGGGGRGRGYRDDADMGILEDELDGWTFAEHAGRERERERERDRERGARRKSQSRSRSRGQPRRSPPMVYHYDRM